MTISTTNPNYPKETTIIKELQAPVELIFNHSHPEGPNVGNLVSRNTADKLLERYWESVHPVARVIHRPSFAQRYETLWEAVEEGHKDKIVPSLSAIVLSVLLSAVVSMSDTQVWTLCQVSREELKNKLKLGTEAALGRAQLLSSSKIETLQAFVAYLVSFYPSGVQCSVSRRKLLTRDFYSYRCVQAKYVVLMH